MATMTKARTYESFFRDVNSDLIMILRYSMTIQDEIKQLREIQTYWNQIVGRSYYWNDLSKKELNQISSINKINRYLKMRLIDDCRRAIIDTNKCKTTSFDAMFLKKKLMEEYADRMIYIKNTF